MFEEEERKMTELFVGLDRLRDGDGEYLDSKMLAEAVAEIENQEEGWNRIIWILKMLPQLWKLSTRWKDIDHLACVDKQVIHPTFTLSPHETDCVEILQNNNLQKKIG